MAKPTKPLEQAATEKQADGHSLLEQAMGLARAAQDRSTRDRLVIALQELVTESKASELQSAEVVFSVLAEVLGQLADQDAFLPDARHRLKEIIKLLTELVLCEPPYAPERLLEKILGTEGVFPTTPSDTKPSVGRPTQQPASKALRYSSTIPNDNKVKLPQPKGYGLTPDLSAVKINRSYTVEDLADLFSISLPSNRSEQADFVREFQVALQSRIPNYADLIREALPISAIEVSNAPNAAPEVYQGLRGPETPPEFIKRVYAPWLGQGLTRAHIGKLDPKLYTAIANWLSRPGNEWPSDVDLPTKAEQTSRWVERVRSEGLTKSVEGMSGEDALRTAGRYHGALHRRKER